MGFESQRTSFNFKQIEQDLVLERLKKVSGIQVTSKNNEQLTCFTLETDLALATAILTSTTVIFDVALTNPCSLSMEICSLVEIVFNIRSSDNMAKRTEQTFQSLKKHWHVSYGCKTFKSTPEEAIHEFLRNNKTHDISSGESES